MSWGISRWGTAGVPVGAFTGATQTSPIAGNLDARGYATWTFWVKGTISAGGITVQGTPDGTTWSDLVPDSTGSSTGSSANPIVGTDALMRFKGPLYGVRGVSSGDFAGSATLVGMAAP